MNSKKYRLAYSILSKLQDFSKVYVNIIMDQNLEIAGLSYIDEMGLPIIRLNLTKIPVCESTIAHVLAHEYGHHVMNHVRNDPRYLSIEQLENCEDEADEYAQSFLKYFDYDLEPVEQFVRTTTHSNRILLNRLNILYK
jgi:Zn-dependent peptidase ImmA (M78 family)